ncbi:MAG TPA: S-adenosyl-methyltransferase [Flavobacteriaceae bacterium]|nr:S-adenosyl-methyltransferase [Flavobacteriaceae bacterium]
MKESLLHIIRGQFLINRDALKTWKFILFLSALAMIMISSAHRVDKKVHKIAALSEEVKQLKSQFVAGRMALMNAKMETKIIKAMALRGLLPSEVPPKKIIIASNAHKDE